jgi:hypothetical protein
VLRCVWRQVSPQLREVRGARAQYVVPASVVTNALAGVSRSKQLDGIVQYSIYISEVLNTRRRFLPETIEKLETVTVFRSIDRFECCVYRS